LWERRAVVRSASWSWQWIGLSGVDSDATDRCPANDHIMGARALPADVTHETASDFVDLVTLDFIAPGSPVVDVQA
jgi:hypothetical protein